MSTVDELTRYLKELTALAAGRVFPPQARRAAETSATAIWLMDSSVTFADAAVSFNPGVDWHDVI